MTDEGDGVDVWLRDVVIEQITDWLRNTADLDELAAMWSEFQAGSVIQVHDRFGTASFSYRDGKAWRERE